MRLRSSLLLLSTALTACGTPVGGGGGLPFASDTGAVTDASVAPQDTPSPLDAPSAPDAPSPLDAPSAPDAPSPLDAPSAPDAVDVSAPDVVAAQDVLPPPSDSPPRCVSDPECGVGRFCDSSGACLAQRCTPNARQCVSTTRARICDNRGSTSIDTDCPSMQRCSDGQCLLNACEPHAARCSDPFTRAQCNAEGSMESSSRCPSGQGCRDGACFALVCAPNAARCTDNTTRALCTPDGTSERVSRCLTGQRCSAGVCVAVACEPSSVSCASATVRRACDSIGSSFTDTACPAAANAAARCTSGVCGTACNAGFADCDGTSSNGCEATLASNPAHCGACGSACAAGQSCASGVCTGGSTGAWSASWGVSNEDKVNAVAVDPAGNTAAAFMFGGTTLVIDRAMISNGGIDGVVASVAPSGAVRWTQQIGGAGNDTAFGVAVDDAGNVYACGGVSSAVTIGNTTIAPSDGALDTWVASWTSSGAFRWARGMGGTLSDQCLGIAVDNAGSVYIGGNFLGGFNSGARTFTTAGMGDVFIVRMSATDGATFAARQIGDTGGEFFGAIAARGEDGVVVGLHWNSSSLTAGGARVGNSGNNDALVVRYGSDLGFRHQMLIASNNGESISGLGIDALNNVYFAAQTSGTSLTFNTEGRTFGVNDSFVGSMSASGALRWVLPIGATVPSSATEVARALTVLRDGTSYTVGTTTATTMTVGSLTATGNGAQNAFTLVANSAGVPTALRVSEGLTNSLRPLGVAVNNTRLVIGGELTGTATYEGRMLTRPGSNTDAFALNVAR